MTLGFGRPQIASNESQDQITRRDGFGDVAQKGVVVVEKGQSQAEKQPHCSSSPAGGSIAV
jgi:hypothetical protein